MYKMMPDISSVQLIRRRFIPDEYVPLKDDRILFYSEEKIITKWQVLKPRKDFSKGISCYYINDGIKVSQFFTNENQLYCYYCDIIEPVFCEKEDTIIFNDLLADVVVTPDGTVKVLDVGEIGDALQERLITQEQAIKALHCLDKLLGGINCGQFSMWAAILDEYQV